MARATAENNGPLSRIVVRYADMMERLVAKAKENGFTAADWEPLAELVAVDEFKRVGCFREVMSWSEYTAFLTGWACSTAFASTLRRITEVPGLVYYEIEERHTREGQLTVVDTLSVFEFNKAGKLCKLNVYLQREL
ncbi:MAG: hypothetical protein EPO08_06595 [Rhodospirillaceae bacterium]|nr:MAG: hypothetical protein EPO08_06595 [Rhodospirillaceae bacterium]